MQFTAKIKRVPFSPYKLRPIADVIRGKNILYAINWLNTYKIQRVVPLLKMIESALANARNKSGLDCKDLIIKEIRVDEGGMFKYHKPGAMGRAAIQRRRFAHASVILGSFTELKEV